MATKTRVAGVPRSPLTRAILWVWLAAVAFLVFFPVMYAVLGTFHTTADINSSFWKLFTGEWTFDNIRKATAQSRISDQLLNSVIVTVAQTTGQFITSVLAAYAIVFGRIKATKVLVLYFTIPIMLPSEVTIIVNYLTVRSLGFYDSVVGIFLPYLMSAFTVFLFIQAFRSFPKEIHEAAVLEGVGPMRFLFTFVIPLNRAVAMTAIVTSAIAAWNGYMWPLLITATAENRTIQPGLKQLVAEHSVDTGMILAGLTIASIPMLLLIIAGQRYLTRGLTEGAVK